MDLYAPQANLKLDERRLSTEFGVSRTPIREALARLEQEGLVHTLPRRGTFVTCKTKNQIIEMIQVWAALESMAARLITLRASTEQIASLRTLFSQTDGKTAAAHIDEYSETNIRFHQAIIQMSGSTLIASLIENLFLHLRSIRHRTISENNRVQQSIIDHMHIIEALEARDTERAEQRVRQHSLDLAEHVQQHVHWLN